MSGDEQSAEKVQIVLGQIGEHVEPVACRECGKSASACGRTGSFCCQPCAGEPGVAGTSFLTHQPSLPPDSPTLRWHLVSAPEWYACRSCERDVYAPNDPSPREADEVCAECHDPAEPTPADPTDGVHRRRAVRRVVGG